ncbi:dicarboxylate/amino acid:cation symporter [Bacillus andreraoultii]|uniref:dicarboxylate/amino acid:cation symporter n=1 Tax=Bacillus andreraoultii TaxID=1499685 RepID=UPI0005A794F1|nr:dicarboxylate/amino acid:cation symporter [Bacillus andreraoultii]
MKLSTKIIFSLILGAVVGILMNIYTGNIFPYIDQYLFSPLGSIFLNLIKMLVVPLVFFSLVIGVTGLGDPKQLGRIGIKAISYFLLTTALAIIIGIGLAYIFQPGKVSEFNLDNVTYKANDAPPVMDSLLNIIPTNPIQAFAEGDMLQIITFSVFVGFALTVLGDRVKGVTRLFEQGNEIMMYLVSLVMKFAPYGTFGLIASAIGKQGFDAMKAMGVYMFVVLLALLIHAVVTYGSTIGFIAKRSPVQFFKEFFPAMLVAFSTSSSSATLPISMDVAQRKLGVPKSISSFVQPLGATINMDGTAIMQGVATIFIAQVVGADLTLGQLVTVVLTAVLASVGTAAVPGVGLVMLAMVLQSVNLPVEGIALIIGIDRLLDMARTVVNSTGDAACAVMITELEKRKKGGVISQQDDELVNNESISV